MPGLPIDIESETFEKIIILMAGVGNIGKSTTAAALSLNKHVQIVHCDIMCHQFFGCPENMYQKTNKLSTEDKNNLYTYVYNEIINTIYNSNNKIFVIEGYIILFMLEEFDITKKLSEQFKYIWNLSRVKP